MSLPGPERGTIEPHSTNGEVDLRREAQAVAAALTMVALGCGDDGEAAPPSGDAAMACPSLSGTWTIASHCGVDLVGTTVNVQQTDCNISTMFAGSPLSGPVVQDGSFELVGTVSGTPVTCKGKATDKLIKETCTGSCQVSLTR
jgi:hypothetical protein